MATIVAVGVQHLICKLIWPNLKIVSIIGQHCSRNIIYPTLKLPASMSNS